MITTKAFYGIRASRNGWYVVHLATERIHSTWTKRDTAHKVMVDLNAWLNREAKKEVA